MTAPVGERDFQDPGFNSFRRRKTGEGCSSAASISLRYRIISTLPETVLPPQLYSALLPRLDSGVGRVPARPRAAAEIKKDLMRAGATMTVSLADLQRQLEALNQEDQGKSE